MPPSLFGTEPARTARTGLVVDEVGPVVVAERERDAGGELDEAIGAGRGGDREEG